MTPDYIHRYIYKHSSYATRKKAKSVMTNLIRANTNGYLFRCNAFEIDKEYRVEINVNQDKIVATSCNCNYAYTGRCEHVIAALEDMSGPHFYENDSEDDPFANTDEIQLIDGLLPIWKIKEDLTNLDESFFMVEINHIAPAELGTQVTTWFDTVQFFNYDKQTGVLHTMCTCDEMEQPCAHITVALAEILDIFGADYFKEGYFERKIAEFLEPYQMTLESPYQDLFEFTLDENGFSAESKQNNLMTLPKLPDAITQHLDQEAEMHLPFISKENTDYGLGFCLFANKNISDGFYPVRAKYNKAKTDFSSGFQEIRLQDLDEFLLLFKENDTQKRLFDALRMSYLLEQYSRNGSVDVLKQALTLQKTILPELENELWFFSNTRKTFVRKHLEPLTIVHEPVKLVFKLTETPLFYNLKAQIEIREKKYNLTAARVVITPSFVKLDNLLFPLTNAELSMALTQFAEEPETNYFKREGDNFFSQIIQPLSAKYEIQSSLIKKEKKALQTANVLAKQVYISDVNEDFIVFKLVVSYDGQLVPIHQPAMLWTENAPETLRFKVRDYDFEETLRDQFIDLHPDFEDQEGPYYLTPKQLLENHWLLHASEKMKQLGIEVFGANEMKSFKFNLNKPTISVNLKSKIDWFDLEITILFGTQKVSIKELQKAFISKTNYVALDDGTLGVLPEEWMKKMAIYFKTGEVKKEGLQMSNYHFGIIDELYETLENTPAFLEALYLKKMRLQQLSTIEQVAVPKAIKATLRDYQLHGLNWLAFLEENQLGGCLADDMGLGKTLQTIAFLAHLKQKDKKVLPSLIIAPTSLIFNWNAELTKFCPSLKALTFTGANRMNDRMNFKDYDIILSTYGSLLNDVESLKDFHFNYVILDESQAIKNPNSKRYKAVQLLQSNNRLVLTGTPIENNTFDLYAQLNFLNPGLLGSRNHFKTEFSDHIDKAKNSDTAALLNKLISPFILRRTKEQVAKELPDKTETILYCEMGKEQRLVYDGFKNEYRDYLLHKIDENGVEKSQMYILEGLTKLRQICNSTQLINKGEEDYGNFSAKLELLMEQIKDKTGEHKILVFSQFVKMLQIVKHRLEEEQIAYEYLDGKTQNRQENVDNFQNNSSVRVFLISLKAGGTGLNLTQADYVFIMDPWWNPAVENQAIDRCYRIGQTKNVMAYRMICKDTIEEKIVMLQNKKRKVAESIITIDEESKSFDVQQVKELFS